MNTEPDPEGAGLIDLSLNSQDSKNKHDADDDIQDWSILNKMNKSKRSKNVPKRGEKDFEPILKSTGDESTNAVSQQISDYDIEALNNSRNSMFDALVKKRGFVSPVENLTSSTIYLDLKNGNACFMLKPKGKFLESMGKIDKEGTCHFNFEEALYLVERGTSICKIFDKERGEEYYNKLPPVSLQSMYTMLIKEPKEINNYLVYSILKRNGYVVNRHVKEFEETLPQQNPIKHEPMQSFFGKLKQVVSSFLQKIFSPIYYSYSSLFAIIRLYLIPQGGLARFNNSNDMSVSENYDLVFDVWKPSSNYKKRNPPLPDYQIAVINSITGFPKSSAIQQLINKSLTTPVDPDAKTKGSIINKVQTNGKKVTFAIVDDGLVNFILLEGCDFGKAGAVWKDEWFLGGPASKKHHKKRKGDGKKKKSHKSK
ncbi:unnamed protein product [Ambrosiozyma monospora]|uniref:Unnamed protein product n=1 Tax=Ambrosiozyma monospora TaxID=43982 RepID=A0A9W6YSN2_AMBMO|nr:unnamed protein product [Ambrosiozyma monospora]